MSASGAPDFEIEELGDGDLPQVVSLLCEGFPMRSPAYWRNGLARLGARTRPPTTEKYGYGLVSNGALAGVVLSIPSIHEGIDGPMALVNISSWYARPAFRGPPAKELYRHATRRDDVSYTNLSAAPHTIKTITAFGFREWSAGQVIAVSWHNEGSSPAAGRVLTTAQAEAAGLSAADGEVLADHERLGCLTLVVETDDGLSPLIFVRRRIKGLVPCAQLIYCRDLREVVDNGRRVGAALARRGFPLLLVDASGPVPGLTGRYVAAKASKYVKGPRPANAVDHLYSEMVLLGF